MPESTDPRRPAPADTDERASCGAGLGYRSDLAAGARSSPSERLSAAGRGEDLVGAAEAFEGGLVTGGEVDFLAVEALDLDLLSRSSSLSSSKPVAKGSGRLFAV